MVWGGPPFGGPRQEMVKSIGTRGTCISCILDSRVTCTSSVGHFGKFLFSHRLIS